MDITVQYFYEAARYGSMRVASDRLGVAVSSVSRQIARLEREMGIALFERNRRAIRLTEAGQIVFEHHRSRMADSEALRERLDALRGMHRGRVNLSIGEGFLSLVFIELIEKFQTANPGLDISVVVESTSDSVRHVLEDEAHIGLVFQAPAEPNIRLRASVAQPLLVICRPDHPITKRGSITLRELSDHSLALSHKDTRMRQLLAAVEAKRGIWLEPNVVSNSIYTLRELAKAGRVVTLLPKVSVLTELEENSLVCLPIAEPELEATEMAVITRIGRQLTGAPSRILPFLEMKLRTLG